MVGDMNTPILPALVAVLLMGCAPGAPANAFDPVELDDSADDDASEDPSEDPTRDDPDDSGQSGGSGGGTGGGPESSSCDPLTESCTLNALCLMADDEVRACNHYCDEESVIVFNEGDQRPVLLCELGSFLNQVCIPNPSVNPVAPYPADVPAWLCSYAKCDGLDTPVIDDNVCESWRPCDSDFEECVEVPLCLQADGSILNDCAPADMCTIIEDAEIDGALAPGMTRWCAATGEVCLHNESVFPGGPFPADEPVWTCEAGECSGSACVTL